MPEDAGAGRQASLREIFTYAAAAVLPLVVIASLMKLWQADLSIPFVYSGDTLYYLAGVKGLFESGSHLVNPALGAPGVSQTIDFPDVYALHFLVLRLMGWLGAGPSTAINLLYLLGYPATGVATVFAMRRLRTSHLVSLAVAVLYALLPYHWMRGEGHLYLSLYWIVPLLMVVAVWVDSAEPPLVKSRAGGSGFWHHFRSRRSLAAFLICAVAGLSGAYYPFFGCFLILAVGVRAALRDRNGRVALAAAGLVAVVVLAAGLQFLPNLVHTLQHGSNPVLARNASDAEVYGLKITQMLLPIDGHRMPIMASFRTVYRQGLAAMGPYLDNEANTAALGGLGALGFLLSVVALLLGWPRTRRRPAQKVPEDPATPALLGFLNVSAVLFATVGWFGALLAATFLPQIRAYNRISVFVGLFSLAALGLVADRWLRNLKGTWRRIAGGMVVGLVVLAGVLDQTPASLSAGPAEARASYATDAAFARQVQAGLPPGSSVFQLPYMAFPSPSERGSMRVFDPLRPYLHTTGLHWSYGAMMGRVDDTWQQATASLPEPAMIQELRAKGFAAVWVQLNGYADHGAGIEQVLNGLLGPPLALRGDRIFAVWRL